ncbi:MAG: S8/S53 family peptidase [Bacteroidota bacterium]
MSLQKNLFTLLVLLLLWSCSKDSSELELSPNSEQDPMPKSEIDAEIKKQLDHGTVYNWNMASDQLLWSALVQSDSIVALGYQTSNTENIKDKIHEIDPQEPTWSAVKEDLIEMALEAANRGLTEPRYTREDILMTPGPQPVPAIMIKIWDKALLAELRTMDEVRYVEVATYTYGTQARSAAGCGGAVGANNIPAQDFTSTSPQAIIPWTYDFMNVPAAWSQSTGQGVKVAVIDSGTSPSQSKLGSEFNSGQSQGRSLQRDGTFISSWWPWARPDGPNDDCGHGTQMAGLVAAPRGFGGTPAGVAYNCNLFSIRGTDDVVINDWREKQGVRDALILSGNDGAVKIISMSLGDIFYSSTVADGIFHAYNRNKLIFAAAGTSTWFTNWVGVVFPASMSQTVAVTGVKDVTPLAECNECHYGSQVDFVAVMQRASNGDRTALSLAMSGNTPSYIGGSSAATAMTAGVAALVWSRYPNWSRSTVLNRLKTSASIYPSRDSDFGWGIIDAALAVQ